MPDPTSPAIARWRADLVALLAVAALPLVKFWSVALGVAVFSGGDHAWINLPLKAASRAALAEGSLPLWNKALSCGTPHLAQAEAGLFYLGNALIYLPLDLLRAYGWTLLLHMMLFGGATYVLIRLHGVRPHVAATLAGLLTLSPYVLYNLPTSNVFQTFWFVPVLLSCVEWARRRSPWPAGAAGGLLLGQLLLLGRPTVALYTLMALGAVAMAHVLLSARRGAVLARFAIFFGLTGIVGVLCGAVQLLATLDFIPLSSRGSGLPFDFTTAGSWLGWNRLYGIFLFPTFPFDPGAYTGYHTSNPYLGVVPAALALLGLRLTRRDPQRVVPVIVGCGFSLLLAMGPSLPGVSWLWSFPPLSWLRYPGRALPVFLCLAMVLAALSWEALLRRYRWPHRRYGIALAVFFGLALLTYLLQTSEIVSPGFAPLQALVQLSPLLVFLLLRPLRESKRWLNAAVIAACSLQIAPLAFRYADFTLSRATFQAFLEPLLEVGQAPPGGRRLITGGIENFASASVNSPALGNGPLLAGADVVNEFNQFTWADWRRIERLLIHPETRGERPMPPGRGLVDLIGLDWLYLPGGRPLEAPDWRQAQTAAVEGQAMTLWRRDSASPTAHVVYEVLQRDHVSPDALVALLESGELDPARQLLLTDPTAPPVSGSAIRDHRVEEQPAGPNAFRFHVSGSSDGYLVVRDHDAPGWSASIDSAPVDHYRVNGLFKAVHLPPGSHVVEFRYRPRHLATGLAASAGGILLGLIVLAAGARRQRKSPSRRPAAGA